MIAFNVVRFRVKPERDQEFLGAHKGIADGWPGHYERQPFVGELFA